MTKIEWTDETWNPVTGCTKVSQGCKNCYAERLWPKVAGAEAKRTGEPARDFTAVRCHPERLDAPLHWKKPRRIFVNSMSDLFHEDVHDEFIVRVFDVMRQCENGFMSVPPRAVTSHTFQILTKRPERMYNFCSRLRFSGLDARGMYLALEESEKGFNPMTALRNVHLGVSVEDQPTADERIPLLLQTPAALRFVSYEPALGPVDFSQWLSPRGHVNWGDNENPTRQDQIAILAIAKSAHRQIGGRLIEWLIAGGESGPNARPPHPHWFASVRDQCAAADVPFFFKQWGEWAPITPQVEQLFDQKKWSMFEETFVRLDGTTHHRSDSEPYTASDSELIRVGKKNAGRTLDGHIHDEFPA